MGENGNYWFNLVGDGNRSVITENVFFFPF